jgi:proteic killer suppression protein
MIRSFADKESQRLFMGRKSRAVSGRARRRAERLEEFRVSPGNRLHKLSGNREGQWAISINDQYRICFSFDGEAGDAHGVEVTDYH